MESLQQWLKPSSWKGNWWSNVSRWKMETGCPTQLCVKPSHHKEIISGWYYKFPMTPSRERFWGSARQLDMVSDLIREHWKCILLVHISYNLFIFIVFLSCVSPAPNGLKEANMKYNTNNKTLKTFKTHWITTTKNHFKKASPQY